MRDGGISVGRVRWVSIAAAAIILVSACSSSDKVKQDATSADAAAVAAALGGTTALSDQQITQIAAANGPGCQPATIQQVAAEDAAAGQPLTQQETQAIEAVGEEAAPPLPVSATEPAALPGQPTQDPCATPLVAPVAGVPAANFDQLPQPPAQPPGQPAARSAGSKSGPYVVVMGDSYSSGEGTAWHTPNVSYTRGDCHNAWPNYGFYSGAAWADIACSGAVASDVLTVEQNGYLPQVQQLKALIANQGRVPNVVMFSIGGNDLKFPSTIETCVLAKVVPFDPGNNKTKCSNLMKAVATQLEQNLHANRVTNTIKAIRATSPGSNIMVVGYPALFAKAPKSSGCAVYPGTAARMRALTRAANGQASNAAKANNAVFVSTTPEFNGHHLCDGNGSNDWFVPLKALAPQAAHPRWNGHQAIGLEISTCWANWTACSTRGSTRSGRSLKDSGGSGGVADLEDDHLPAAAVPAAPGAPTLAKKDPNVLVTIAAAAGATSYEIFQRTADGDIAVGGSDGAGVVEVGPVPGGAQCFGVVAVADDEGATSSPVACLDAAPTAPVVKNRPPTSSSSLVGMCKASARTRSVADQAADPDGTISSFNLISTSFGRSDYHFSWRPNGTFTMTIPANNTATTKLEVRWAAVDNQGAQSAIATMTVRPVSC